MRARTSLLLGLVPALLTAIACGDSSSSAPPTDAGSGDDGGVSTVSYTPKGCSYTYAPPSTLGYQDIALDDPTATTTAAIRIRVGLGGGTAKGKAGYADPSTMAAFTWETAGADHVAKVKIGTSASALTTIQSGYTWTLKPTIGSTDSYFHEVHVCGLTAGTTYYYSVGGGASGKEVWSTPQPFTTVPATGMITVGVFGDARDKVDTWQAVHMRMRDAGAALSLIGGDVVDIGAEESLYSQWLDAIVTDPSKKPLTLGSMPILVVNGNHEADTATSFANFAMPGTDQYSETYASFDVGNTHFVMLDDQQIADSLQTGALSTEAKAQLAWLDADLAAADADRTAHPFVVAISHRGIYSTSLHAADPDVVPLRGALGSLYDKHHVDLAINGHDHEYERTVPINVGSPSSGDPKPTTGGTTYVICAGAGAEPYSVGTTAVAWRQTKTAFGGTTPYLGTYSLLTLNGNSLTLKAYGLKASGSDDVIDTLTLTH